MSTFKLFIVSFIIAWYGFAQIVCICAAHNEHIAYHSHKVQSSQSAPIGQDESPAIVAASNSIEKNESGGGEEECNCGQCEINLPQALLSKDSGSLDAIWEIAALNSGVRIAPVHVSPANMAPTALAGLRWLDPTYPTPISQKTLLQI